jgi:hypothetical protein
VDLHDVLVPKGLQDLCLNEDGVDVTDRPDVLGFDDLDGVPLARLLMLRQEHLSEASLPQQLQQLVLCEAAGRVELLSSRDVQDSPILDEVQVLLEVL